jgi:xanthine dehydrogenase large subunit
MTAVGTPVPDESAALHVTGRAAYVDDLAEPARTVHGALVLSGAARGRFVADTMAALGAPGVVGVLTGRDVAKLGARPAGEDEEPLLAEDDVRYLGQPLALVVAVTRRAAQQAARLVVVRYDRLPPVLDPHVAQALGDGVAPAMAMTRPSRDAVDAALAAAPRTLSGTFRTGGQEHFYLEPITALAEPLDDGGVRVRASTQNPTEVQHEIAEALGLRFHKVRVECRRIGGGFGGKELHATSVAALAAVAAVRFGRPVKVRLDRLEDDVVTGQRHPVEAAYDVGFDDDGRILAYRVRLLATAGYSADLSAAVLTRAMCHLDGAYWVPAFAADGFAARTNHQSSTAFRGFGAPQGSLLMEVVLDSVARSLGKDALDVRLVNLYRDRATARDPHAGLTTPYGMVIKDNVLPELVEQLLRMSDYARRRENVDAFNARSPVLKRGLALTPVKFGIGFSLCHLNQAGATVHVYTDGSVLVNHAAIEMGQGVNTKVAQVVADVFGIPPEHVRSTATDTDKVPNTSATAASRGSDMNGAAAQAAALTVRGRLAAVAADLLGCAAPDVGFRDGFAHGPAGRLVFKDVALEAYLRRVQLWANGFHRTPGLHWDQARMTGTPHQYFCYGASVSEVALDTLTGEHRVLRADLLHDVGRSLNPLIDRGQVEGAFMQGMGWLTSEEMRWQDQTGELLTLAPTTYKVPAVHDVPQDFRVALFDNVNQEDVVHASKAVGEPPLLLAFSVFLAIRDAVSAVGGHRWDPPLDAPATAEAVLAAVGAVRDV